MGFNTDAIRNVAIAGHGSTGKTSLLESILFNGDVLSKTETVDSGRTLSDYTDEEKERKISIHTTLSHISWNDNKINMLDTPGSADFVGEVVAAFRSAESAIIVLSGDAGVQIETIKLWRRLNQREMPRIVFINKMDKERSEYLKNLNDLEEKFDVTFVPITIPMGEGEGFKGVINLIEEKAYLIPEAKTKEQQTDIPSDMQKTVEEYRMKMIESAAEGDDDLLEKYFEEGTLTPDEIRRGLKEGIKANKLVPLLCGSAEKNCGLRSLLNFLSYAAPSPAVIEEKGRDKDGNEKTVAISADSPVSCLVFKTSIDQFSGKLSYVKVIGGRLTPEIELYNPRSNKRERVSKLYTVQGKKLEEVKELSPGDMGVLVKLDTVETNDTLCAQDNVIQYNALKLPHPLHAVAINAINKKDEDKLNRFLQRAAEEDLTFEVKYNAETKETVIAGMGELQLNIILKKIREGQKIELETRVPKIAYRETITKSSEAEYTHKKQSGGHGQYGKVFFQVKPIERGQQLIFLNAIKGGAVSKGYIPGIEKGIQEGMEHGVLAGYPLVDIEVKLIDGKEHPVDSSEMSFKLAARGALKEAITKASPVLLEPIMKLSVFVDDQYMGDVLSDISSKRGKVLGQKSLGGGIQEIDAEVPQAELLKYSIDLRSITSGTGSFEIDFGYYNPISGRIADAVATAAKQESEVTN